MEVERVNKGEVAQGLLRAYIEDPEEFKTLLIRLLPSEKEAEEVAASVADASLDMPTAPAKIADELAYSYAVALFLFVNNSLKELKRLMGTKDKTEGVVAYYSSLQAYPWPIAGRYDNMDIQGMCNDLPVMKLVMKKIETRQLQGWKDVEIYEELLREYPYLDSVLKPLLSVITEQNKKDAPVTGPQDKEHKKYSKSPEVLGTGETSKTGTFREPGFSVVSSAQMKRSCLSEESIELELKFAQKVLDAKDAICWAKNNPGKFVAVGNYAFTFNVQNGGFEDNLMWGEKPELKKDENFIEKRRKLFSISKGKFIHRGGKAMKMSKDDIDVPEAITAMGQADASSTNSHTYELYDPDTKKVVQAKMLSDKEAEKQNTDLSNQKKSLRWMKVGKKEGWDVEHPLDQDDTPANPETFGNVAPTGSVSRHAFGR